MRVRERWRCGINCTVNDEERFPPFSSFCDFVKYFILNLFLSLLGPYLSPTRLRELFFTFHFVALKTVAIWLKKILTISYFLLFLVLQNMENVGYQYIHELSCYHVLLCQDTLVVVKR